MHSPQHHHPTHLPSSLKLSASSCHLNTLPASTVFTVDMSQAGPRKESDATQLGSLTKGFDMLAIAVGLFIVLTSII